MEHQTCSIWPPSPMPSAWWSAGLERSWPSPLSSSSWKAAAQQAISCTAARFPSLSAPSSRFPFHGQRSAPPVRASGAGPDCSDLDRRSRVRQPAIPGRGGGDSRPTDAFLRSHVRFSRPRVPPFWSTSSTVRRAYFSGGAFCSGLEESWSWWLRFSSCHGSASAAWRCFRSSLGFGHRRRPAPAFATCFLPHLHRVRNSLSSLCALTYLSFDLEPLEAFVLAMTTIATGGFGNPGFLLRRVSARHRVCGNRLHDPREPAVPALRPGPGRPPSTHRPRQPGEGVSARRGHGHPPCWPSGWSPPPTPAGNPPSGKSLFNGISILTGTGYASAGYDSWGGFAVTLFLLIRSDWRMCRAPPPAASRCFRFQVLLASLTAEIRLLRNPRGMYTPRYEGDAIPQDVIASVSGFLFLFVASLITLTILLSMTGLDLLTAASGAATALANVGPGLGPIIGPEGKLRVLAGCFEVAAHLRDAARPARDSRCAGALPAFPSGVTDAQKAISGSEWRARRESKPVSSALKGRTS